MNGIEVGKAIRTAIKVGDVDEVVNLIGTDKERLNMMTLFGTWLHVAATCGHLEIVKRLIAMGADVNAKGGVVGGGALSLAAANGRLAVAEYLLSCGADLDVSVSEQNPLFAAIYAGHTAVARLLIDHGIDTRIKYTGENMKDMDALAFAVEWGRNEIAEMLRGR